MPIVDMLNQLGGGLIGGVAQSWMQGRINQQSMDWIKAMYNMQRKDALADWTMQNEYNSPKAQMKRLEDAGLNPMLVYGNGATATSSAGVRATPAQSTEPGREYKVPGGVGSLSLDEYFNAQVKQVSIDKMKADLAYTEFLKGKGEAMLPGQLEGQGLENKLKDIGFDYKVNQISQLMNQWTLGQEQIDYIRRTKEDRIEKVAEEVLLMQARRAHTDEDRRRVGAAIDYLKKSTILKDLDIQLERIGIGRNSPWYTRILGRLFNLGGDVLSGDGESR